MVITDHSSLKWLCNLHNPTGRLARWALELQAYDFEIVHCKGSLNYVPDALSRTYEDEADAELASIEIAEETSDAWYKDRFASVAANSTDHPYWKIIHGRLYMYRPNPMIEDLMEDEDAWKLVLSAEKRENALLKSHAEPTAGHYAYRYIIGRLCVKKLRISCATDRFANNARCNKRHQQASWATSAPCARGKS